LTAFFIHNGPPLPEFAKEAVVWAKGKKPLDVFALSQLYEAFETVFYA
jgi:hypothetical protein